MLTHLRKTRFIHAFSDILLDILNCVTQLLSDCMSAKRLDIEIICFRRENKKCDDSCVWQ
jgi:hypothetical protein